MVVDALAKCAKVGSDLQVSLEDRPEDIAHLPLWFWVMPLDVLSETTELYVDHGS